MQLAGKVVVVTGGGNGIGQQLVLALLKKGARVAAVDIKPEALQDTQNLAASLAGNLTLHQTDVANRDAVSRLATEVIQQHGHVDALINNAGIIHTFNPLNTLDYTSIDRVLNINLFGVINMTKTFLPLLLERPVAHIVNVSSMGGLFAFPKQSIYGASKAAVKLLSEGLYAELRNTQVGVSVVFPGAVKTNITLNCDAHPKQWEKIVHKRAGTAPDAAARRILTAIEKNQFRVHIGLDSKILSALYRLLPKSTIILLSKVMQIALPD